ncbi:hypothetical protein V490_03159 [Pseudogymnoascus sp. VKM F-3557]|nr:hypothetical protein V490_03159 [Pseudogymnoascus sp. VKM F-3557]
MGDRRAATPSRHVAPKQQQPAAEPLLNCAVEATLLIPDARRNVDVGRPNSLLTPISPPRSSRRLPNKLCRTSHKQLPRSSADDSSPPAAKRSKHFHLSHLQVPPYLAHLPPPPLPLIAFDHLHNSHLTSRGHLFVIHQHDHPIAGLHYDLRLQISATSSLSWAIPFGVPGNPNSKRRVRIATETRVHTVRSHLVEGATRGGGSMLVWDGGVYEVLARGGGEGPGKDPGSAEGSQSSNGGDGGEEEGRDKEVSENAKLIEAFGKRKIRIRLHGARLPRGYTLDMFVAHGSQHLREPRQAVKKKKRRRRVSKAVETSSEGEEESGAALPVADVVDEEWALAWERKEVEKREVRRVNAYPGAENTVGSLYQRKWFLCLDREGSGFCRAGRDGIWERRHGEGGELEGFEPFYVSGVEDERSVVTGRRADDVMRDAGVVGFVRRKGWRAVLD